MKSYLEKLPVPGEFRYCVSGFDKRTICKGRLLAVKERYFARALNFSKALQRQAGRALVLEIVVKNFELRTIRTERTKKQQRQPLDG